MAALNAALLKASEIASGLMLKILVFILGIELISVLKSALIGTVRFRPFLVSLTNK